ncbi:MAG TPA: hypothetical protein VLA52_07105 [Thermohalobaculum sp.]|nr:hypothetical protein [Thermohalobaculum sp.]
MAHNIQNFDYHAGDNKPLDFTVYDEDPANPGQPDLASPVDLTGATIRWALSAFATDAAPLLTKTTALGITITDAAAGKFRVSLDKADTVALNGKYYHEAEVLTAGAADDTVATGTVTVAPTVLD